jgi:hypothetical protein
MSALAQTPEDTTQPTIQNGPAVLRATLASREVCHKMNVIL